MNIFHKVAMTHIIKQTKKYVVYCVNMSILEKDVHRCVLHIF